MTQNYEFENSSLSAKLEISGVEMVKVMRERNREAFFLGALFGAILMLVIILIFL